MQDKEENNAAAYTKQMIDRLVKMSGMQQVKKSGQETRLQLPYLHYEMFDIQGVRKMAPFLMKLLHWPTIYSPIYLEDSDSKFISFMLGYKLYIHPWLYASDNLRYPLTLELNTDYVKRTSTRFTVHMKERDNSRALSTATWVDVNVDAVTKQPSPFPSWWKQKYGFPTDGPALVFKPQTKPSTGVIVTQRKVHFTDVDTYRHPHFDVYITYCLDAFYENILRDKYINGPKVFLNGWLNSMSVMFKSDSAVGDNLTIESWEDTTCKNTYHFEVSHEGRIVVVVTFKFYSSLAENSHL